HRVGGQRRPDSGPAAGRGGPAAGPAHRAGRGSGRGAMTAADAPLRPSEPAGTEPEPRKRLHPLSPVLHGAKSIAVIVAALSWQTLSQVGLERFALVVAVLAVGVVVFSVISWLNTGYHV